MKIKIVFDLDEYARRCINHTYGDDSPADHTTCRDWIETMIEATLQDLAYDYVLAHQHKDEEQQ